jgi:hypothetical protein
MKSGHIQCRTSAQPTLVLLLLHVLPLLSPAD